MNTVAVEIRSSRSGETKQSNRVSSSGGIMCSVENVIKTLEIVEWKITQKRSEEEI
jgi:hypothetical protein